MATEGLPECLLWSVLKPKHIYKEHHFLRHGGVPCKNIFKREIYELLTFISSIPSFNISIWQFCLWDLHASICYNTWTIKYCSWAVASFVFVSWYRDRTSLLDLYTIGATSPVSSVFACARRYHLPFWQLWFQSSCSSDKSIHKWQQICHLVSFHLALHFPQSILIINRY